MKDKTIVFVINSAQTMSGASKVMQSVAIESLNLFSKVIVVGILNSQMEDMGNDAIEFVPLDVRCSIKGLWRLNCLIKLRSIFKKYAPDIICSFVADACTMSRIASIGLMSKVISCERGDPYTTCKLWQFLMKITYRTSDYVVFQLPSARDFFSCKVKEHSEVIPNPFIPKAVAINRENVKSKTIVSAGRLYDLQKDFSSLIRAFSLIHNEFPDYKLIIYGEGQSRPHYEKLIDLLGLCDVVSLPGFVNNVSEEIKDKSIFVLSSVFEGIPNTLLEAMSMGLPCIATKCSPGGAEFLTQDGNFGLLINVGDVVEMANAIKYLILNEQEAYTLGIKAKESIVRFKTETILNCWIRLFEKVMLL